MGNSYITLFFEADIFDSNDVHRAKYNKTIDTLKNCVELVNSEVASFNAWLDEEIKPMINDRFEYLRKMQKVAENYMD